MTTVFDALHQTEDFVNSITEEFTLRNRILFNMFLMAQIVATEVKREQTP